MGVDGVAGAGTTTFADELAAVLRPLVPAVVRASVDGFHHPRARRYRRGRDDPDGFWLDSYDYPRLRTELLDPFVAGRPFRRAVHDVATDAALDAPAGPAPAGAVLLLDGIFLQRPELAGGLDLVIWLDAPFAVTYPRMAHRDGTPPEPQHPRNRRYLGGERRYLAECRPAERADVVVDNADLDAPAVRAVRCPSARTGLTGPAARPSRA